MQAPVWRPFALSKEKVTGCVGPLNLLQFAKDTAQHTSRVLPLLVDKNIHYRILKFLYGAKNQRWNMRAYLLFMAFGMRTSMLLHTLFGCYGLF